MYEEVFSYEKEAILKNCYYQTFRLVEIISDFSYLVRSYGSTLAMSQELKENWCPGVSSWHPAQLESEAPAVVSTVQLLTL